MNIEVNLLLVKYSWANKGFAQT